MVLFKDCCLLRWQFLLSCFSGLLYYAGHGYENFGNSFMVPVDAQIRIGLKTVCVYRIYWNWCKKRKRDSTCSCWTCAGKGRLQSPHGDLLVAVRRQPRLAKSDGNQGEAFGTLRELLNFRLWWGLIRKKTRKRFSLYFPTSPCSRSDEQRAWVLTHSRKDTAPQTAFRTSSTIPAAIPPGISKNQNSKSGVPWHLTWLNFDNQIQYPSSNVALSFKS